MYRSINGCINRYYGCIQNVYKNDSFLYLDLMDLKHKHEEQVSKHTSHIHTLNVSLTNLKSSVTSLTNKVQKIESKMSDLENIATQLDMAQVS